MERKIIAADSIQKNQQSKQRVVQSKVQPQNIKQNIEKESKIKQTAKRFFRASIVCILGASAVFSGGLYSYNQRKDYATWGQVEEISNALNCDMSYMNMVNKRAIKTFQHNNGEPIYVSLPKGATETTNKAIGLSLEYMFNIMEQINPNYTYKIVTSDELDKYKIQGKSTIEFKRSETKLPTNIAAEAMVAADRDLTSIFTLGKMVDNYTITYDANELENQNESVEKSCEVFLHELLHVFSFDDVYDRDAVYANTFIHPSIGEKYDVFMPNDLKCLISTYAPKLNSNLEKRQYIEKMKQLVSNYETAFYRDVIASEKRSTTVPIENENVSLLLKDTIKSNKQSYDYYYKVEVQNGKYTFEILDGDKKVIDKVEGDAVFIDGVFILKDANLKYGLSRNLDRAMQGEIASYENLMTDIRIYKYRKTIYDEEYSCLVTTNFTLPEHCTVEASKGFETKVQNNEIVSGVNEEEYQAER